MENVPGRIQKTSVLLLAYDVDCFSRDADAAFARGNGNVSVKAILNCLSAEYQERLSMQEQASIEEPSYVSHYELCADGKALSPNVDNIPLSQ